MCISLYVLGMWLVAEETANVIGKVVEVFQSHNPTWPHTRVIFSDKDFTERNIFSEYFPHAELKICLFHVLRAFRREITTEKMGISTLQRETCLKIFTELAYARSESQYSSARQKLQDTKIQSVISYFENNWHNIKEEWVHGFKSQSLTLGETTNNRLESINAKVKSVCSHFATLEQFFDEFFCVLATLRNERNYKAVMSSIRHPTVLPTDEYARNYQQILTPYAYQMFTRQHSTLHTVKLKTSDVNKCVFESSSGEVVATTISCSCCFAKATGLPCKHIITVRRKSSMNPFDKDLVPARWTKDSYTLHMSKRFEGKVDCTTSTGVQNAKRQSKPKILDHFEKYNAAKKCVLRLPPQCLITAMNGS